MLQAKVVEGLGVRDFEDQLRRDLANLEHAGAVVRDVTPMATHVPAEAGGAAPYTYFTAIVLCHPATTPNGLRPAYDAGSPCPECAGTGGMIRVVCDSCHGSGRDPEPERSVAERAAEGSLGDANDG